MDRILSDLHPNNIRYLFYLVSPNETTYDKYDDVPNYTDRASLWLLIFVILEYLVSDEKTYAFNDTVTSINAGICSLLYKFGGRYLSAALFPTVYSYLHIVDLPIHSPWSWLICFLSTDLMYYLGHRAIHEAGVFWSFHQMHHSSEYYNLSTALRQGAVQDIAMAFFDLLQCLYMPPSLFLPHKYLNVLYQYWLHTQTVPSLGPLEFIFNTPSAHRVHHGRNPYCIDRNYGATLIIWDRLFGTYAPEREEEKIVYGLVDPVNSFNQFWLQLFEFKALGWDKGRMKDANGKEVFPGFWNKMKAALYPPGYFPGTRTKWFFLWRCVEDNEEGIPQVDASNVIPYNPSLSRGIKWYLIVQFTFVLIFGLSLNESRLSAPWMELATKLVVMILAIQSFGNFFDHKPYAFTYELSRLVHLAVISYYYQELNGFILAIFSILSLFAQKAINQIPGLHPIDNNNTDKKSN